MRVILPCTIASSMDNWPSGMNTLMWPLSLSWCWTCLWSVSRPGTSEGLPDCLGALDTGPPLWVSIFNIFLSDSFPLAMGMGPWFLWDDLQYKKSIEKMWKVQGFSEISSFYVRRFWTNILLQILKIFIFPKSKQGKQTFLCKFVNHKSIQSIWLSEYFHLPYIF